MKCHYEILELSRDADDAAIKTAYRKLALKWHPDKNLETPDVAKEQFQIVQQAYEVLSDRQERAWYDAHRDQILRGASSEFQDKSLDVFQYFTTTCFKGHSDDEAGFYSVYAKVFEQIAKEDIEFMDEKEEFCEIPGFGRSDSDYETVEGFYDYWMSYSTKKNYSWLDPYDIREGKGDRRLLKLIDKENKKSRQKARKERNEEIRNLVAFVRKRDKRVQAFKKEMEAKTMENRKKQEEFSKQQRLERKQLAASEKQADWLKFDNVKSELEEIEKHLVQEFGEELSQSDEEQEEEDFNNLYCVACNKVFKNPKAFENHEVSKKHKENVERLREAMIDEDAESNFTEDLDEYDDLEANNDNLLNIVEENDGVSGEESIADEENVPECSQADSEKLTEEVKRIKKKKSKVKKVSESEEIVIGKVSEDDDDFDFGLSKNQKKKKKTKNKQKQNDDAPAAAAAPDVEDEVSQEQANKSANKKQQRKEKRRNNKTETDLSEVDLSHCCVTCKNDFPSKNKLFDHLKKTGHGVYLPAKAKSASNSKKANKVL